MLVAADGVDLAADLDAAVKRLTGAPGIVVRITVERAGQRLPVEVRRAGP